MGATLTIELNKYFSLLTPIQQKAVLGLLKSLVKPETDCQRISIEQYNKEIDEAMARVEAGEFYTQEEVEKESASWWKGKAGSIRPVLGKLEYLQTETGLIKAVRGI